MPIPSRLSFLCCIGALLSACSHTSVPQPATTSASYGSALTVTVSASDTRRAVEQRYAADVVVWHPEEGFAILGRHGAALGAQAVHGAPVEANTGTMQAGATGSAWNAPGMLASGRAYFWGAGRSYFWGGGRAYFWGAADGVLGGVAENDALWQRTNLRAAWTLAPNLGDGVTVAVIDTGIDQTHEAFQESLVPLADRHDFVDGDGDPQEVGTLDDALYGHGTNVAGIVLQVAPHARIMPLRVLGQDGRGDMTSVVAAIDWAVTHGAQVINLSLGSVQSSSVLKRMVTYAADRGVYVVASSGNTGDRQITYPARYASGDGALGRYALSVGSVDAQDVKSDFSTYGKALEVTAPGELVYGPVPGGYVSAWSGTSMAAPMATGALTLALAQPLTVKREALGQTLARSGAAINAFNPAYAGEVGQRLDIGAFVRAAVQPATAQPGD